MEICLEISAHMFRVICVSALKMVFLVYILILLSAVSSKLLGQMVIQTDEVGNRLENTGSILVVTCFRCRITLFSHYFC